MIAHYPIGLSETIICHFPLGEDGIVPRARPTSCGVKKFKQLTARRTPIHIDRLMGKTPCATDP